MQWVSAMNINEKQLNQNHKKKMLKVTLGFSHTVSRLAGALHSPIPAFKRVLSPASSFNNFMHVENIKKKKKKKELKFLL